MMTMMVLLLAVTVATAQRGQGHRGNDPLAELDLTAEQQAQIKAIKQDSRAQIQEARKQNPDQRPDRAAMKKMQDASKAKVDAVLTTEQREKMATIKAERKAAWDAVDKEGMRTALKEYDKTKVKPVISAARGQLDQFISAEDQASINRLRPIFASKPKAKARAQRGKGKGKGKGKGEAKGEKPTEADRAARKAKMEAWSTDHAAEIAELKVLTEKYADDLNRIQERMKPQRQQWAKEKREITNSYLPEGAQKGKGGKAKARKGKAAKGKAKGQNKADGKRSQNARGDWPKDAAFLLLKA